MYKYVIIYKNIHTFNMTGLCTTGILTLITLVSDVFGNVKSQDNLIRIEMPATDTSRSDQYMCYAARLDAEETFLDTMTINADSSVVHHVATSICEEPVVKEQVWDCTQMQGQTCRGAAVNFGVWDEFSKTNSQVMLPKNVSVKAGKKTKLKYFLIEIHYREPVKNREFLAANVTLTTSTTGKGLLYQMYIMINKGYIPAKTENGYFSNVACIWSHPPAYAYRYYVHTHHYGYLVEGFLVRNNSWSLIGSQLSRGRSKNLFDIPGGPMLIQPGDVLVARCLYINTGNAPVKFGMGEDKEMCNFEIDLGYEPQYQKQFLRSHACVSSSPEFSVCDHKETAGICG